MIQKYATLLVKHKITFFEKLKVSILVFYSHP